MPLTDLQIKSAQPQYKLSAGLGLYLIISPSGGKWWRVRYRFGGKQKELSVGTYPKVTLKAAAIERDQIRLMVSQGTDPHTQRKNDKFQYQLGNTFKDVYDEWYQKHSPNWSESYAKKTKSRISANLTRWLIVLLFVDN